MNNNDLSDCSKNLICKELDGAIRTLVADYTSNNAISDEATQSLCNVLEAIFIHGLNDAFFLKGSRYSKYPEPNFWPFVSKFTHKNVRIQIAGLKQIRNEVGRARAWIRVVLNENVLENYVCVLAADKNQLRVFYQKSAFLRDHERVDALLGYLKALTPVHFNVATNSSFLNTWTPTPLIMAGLCGAHASGATLRFSSSSRRLIASSSSFSLKSDEDGGGDTSSECLPKSHKIDNQSSLFTVGSPQSREDEEDDRSSVYSHPSLLDGSIVNALPISTRVGSFNLALSCMPENTQLPPPDVVADGYSALTATDEPSAEVIVRRRKTRIRKVSRQGTTDGTLSRSGNNSGELSRSESHAALDDVDIAHKNVVQASAPAATTSALFISKEPSDSGYDNDDCKESPSMSSDERIRRQHSSDENHTRRIDTNLVDENSFANESPQTGLLLHDELNVLSVTRDNNATTTMQSPVPSLVYTPSLAGVSMPRRFASSVPIDFSSTNPSCSSSFSEFSLPVGSFNTAFFSAVGKTDLFFDQERKVSHDSSTGSDFALLSQSRDDELMQMFPNKTRPSSLRKASIASTWSSPTERLIRQLEQRSESLTPSSTMTVRNQVLLQPTSTSSQVLSSPNEFQLAGSPTIVDPTEFPEDKSLSPQVSSQSSAALKVTVTRNVFTDEDVVVHFLTRAFELPYTPLDIARQTLDDDVVVVEHTTLMEADKYGVSQDLLRITRVPLERGLDAQDFRCPSCRKSIGGSFGLFKMCYLDGRYYCEDCWRRGDESVIPARMVWNWDCRRRPICKASRAFLKSVGDQPFIRIDKLNPALYDHSRLMDRIKGLRIKLSLAVMYLFSCKQSVAEDIRRRIFPHDYYHNDIHLYSVMDLEGVLNGIMEKRLNTLIAFCVGHINQCALCYQKGFLCEICQSKRVIYPFQTEITHRCKKCFAVYHLECFAGRNCLKCERRAAFRTLDYQPFSPQPLKNVTLPDESASYEPTRVDKSP